MGAAGNGFELHSIQVHVFGQTPLQHVSWHTHKTATRKTYTHTSNQNTFLRKETLLQNDFLRVHAKDREEV